MNLQNHRWRQPRMAAQLDFAASGLRTAWWSWALLGVSLAATLLQGERAEQVAAQQAEATTELKRLMRAARTGQPERLAAPSNGLSPATGPTSLSDPAFFDGAAEVASRLSYPWAEVIRQVEVAAAGQNVMLLTVDLELPPLGPVVMRAQGAVESDMAALRWAANLPRGELLSRQTLAAPLALGSASYGLKADVQAFWAGELR